jgi:hypothetical protein
MLAFRSGFYRTPAFRPDSNPVALVRSAAGNRHDLIPKSLEKDRSLLFSGRISNSAPALGLANPNENGVYMVAASRRG